jgi:hypothetical protein
VIPHPHLLLVALGALPILGLGGVLHHLDRKTLAGIEGDNDRLQAEIEALQGILEEAVGLEEIAADLALRIAAIAGLTAERTRSQDLLSVIESAVPEQVQITRLVLDEVGLRLEGTGSASDAADVMDGLRAWDCMTQVSLMEAGSGRFQLRAMVDPDEPCPPGEVGRRDLFADPFASPQGDARVPAVVRWPVRDYVVLAAEPGGDAILQDPAGGSHFVTVGGVVGTEYARVMVVADGQVILTQDVVTDAALGRLESRLITLYEAR